MPVSRDDFRNILGNFATGVTIVTTRVGDSTHGMTANAFSSLSLDPPLVLVCVDKTANSHELIAEAGFYAVNILSRGQQDISDEFARKAEGRTHSIDHLAHRFGVTGAPLLEGCLAYLDCRVTDAYEGGDHTIYVARVEDGAITLEGDPLIFFRARYSGTGER